ncbi:SUKH-3 domain-containing protein [Streptomyces sp. ZYX-F-203]
MHADHTPADRFPSTVDAALRAAGWRPGRRDIERAEAWADALRNHRSPAGHRHTVVPAAVETWAEFGSLTIAPTEPGRHVAALSLDIDPMHGLHLARTLADLGRALGTDLCPLGADTESRGLLAMDAEGRGYALDHAGDWYLGDDFGQVLATLLTGTTPTRLVAG